MNNPILMRVTGEVEHPLELTFADLQAFADEHRINEVSQIAVGRSGSAITLAGLLSVAGVTSNAAYLTLHASSDDFHASVPLAAVHDTALLVYADQGHSLPQAAGGPVRFLVPNAAKCRTADIDTCANVKFVDQIELTREKGLDSRL